MYRIKNTSILKEIQMSKSCAFLGNDYKWRRDDIIEKVKEQALQLIAEEGVDISSKFRLPLKTQLLNSIGASGVSLRRRTL